MLSRKRKSPEIGTGSLRCYVRTPMPPRLLVDAHKAKEVVELKEQALQASKREVAQLKEALRAANAHNAAEAGRLAAELEKARAKHAAEVRAVKASVQRALISAKQESSGMLREFYARGLRDMRELAVTLYGGHVDLSELTAYRLLPNSAQNA